MDTVNQYLSISKFFTCSSRKQVGSGSPWRKKKPPPLSTAPFAHWTCGMSNAAVKQPKQRGPVPMCQC